MINSVTLRNFRGFEDTEIPLSNVTLLTGTNGVGKTSVLEGLYCLFSETQLDVSPLVRYNRTLGIMFNQFNGVQNIISRPTYNYRIFWEECPKFSEKPCCVLAESVDKITWQWTYTKARISDIDAKILKEAGSMRIIIDSSTDIALFKWQHKGIMFDKKTHQKINVNNNRIRAQILNPDGGLYLIPSENQVSSVCRYLDFASIRAMPPELSYQMAKKLTEALRIINPRIKDIRISKIENGLSVILDDDKETTLGTIGNGAVTWASTLIVIFEIVEWLKKNDQKINIPIFILVDEIGSGIHYSVMNDIWKYVQDLVVKYPNIQFIATSHSDDCVRTFCETFEKKNNASIVRLHKTINNEIVTTKYASAQFNTIMSGEWEVRG